MIKLEKISIAGFKGFSEKETIPLRNFNVIVGKNDAGKSTILKALDLFFNNRPFLPEYLNNNTEQFSQIDLYFSPNHTEIIIDEVGKTTFEQEGLINQDGLIKLSKIWDGKKSGKINPSYLIKRKHYKELDFFTLSEKQLIKLCKDNSLEAEPGLMTNPQTGEEHNNAEKRERLKELYLENNFQFDYIEDKLPTSGTSRLKKTEQALKRCLPQYEYFLADSSLSESDASIQKYFKDMAFRVIKDEVDTEELETIVSQQLQEVLYSITTKINSVVPENEKVEAKVGFDWSKLITTTFESDDDDGSMPLSSRGDGFRRITMMAYFEHLAEEQSNHQNIIFAFEEPETFLHPSAQENLFEKLSAISNIGYQVVLTTHSPVLVSQTRLSDLLHIYKDGKLLQCKSSIQDCIGVATDLGVTADNQFISLFETAKCFLLVEGIDDCESLTYVSSKYKESRLID